MCTAIKFQMIQPLVLKVPSFPISLYIRARLVHQGLWGARADHRQSLRAMMLINMISQDHQIISERNSYNSSQGKRHSKKSQKYLDWFGNQILIEYKTKTNMIQILLVQ